MTIHTFKAMGTTWWIRCDRPALLEEVEALVHDVESRLSRFLDASALTRLNRTRSADDPMLADVTRAALAMAEATGGAFDPTLGAPLADLGYDRSFERIERPTVDETDPPGAAGSLTVRTDGDGVELEGVGRLDFGGIGKGWTVDRVVDHLRAGGARSVLVDAGGDLRGVGGPWPIGLEHGPVLELTDGAVATSSTRRRRWRTDDGETVHHVLDPRTGRSAETPIVEVTVVADEAATADALATAILVAPNRLLPELDRWGAGAAVRAADGDWWTTPGWKEAS